MMGLNECRKCCVPASSPLCRNDANVAASKYHKAESISTQRFYDIFFELSLPEN